jgi:GR25 family glycosyltransferase involved in LPS biosynthesis
MNQQDMIKWLLCFLLVGIFAICIVYIIVSWPFSEGMKTTKPMKKMRPRPRPRPRPKVINTKPPLPITNLVIEEEEKGKCKGKGTKPEDESSLSNPSIQYYVIHVKTNTFREQNIIDQQETLGQPILVFDAVDGVSFKGVRNIEDFLRKEYDPRIIDDYSPRKKHINEIACYMSHAMLVRSIANGNDSSMTAADYTVIFEDDFQILGGSNLHAKVQRILRIMEREDPDFDMIFLGTVNSGRGVSLTDDIYHFNTSPGLIVYGAHGYVINNKNAKKIYGEMIEIKDVVDVQYFNAMRKGRLRGYVVEPMLVRQQNEKFGTTVRL